MRTGSSTRTLIDRAERGGLAPSETHALAAAAPTMRYASPAHRFTRSAAHNGADMKFEIEADGFLADRVIGLESYIKEVYGSLLRDARNINRECQNALLAAHIERDNGRAIIAATLFMRALEYYKLTIVLLVRDTVAAARVTLRALMETTLGCVPLPMKFVCCCLLRLTSL
jgi:hypothetical protein